MELYLVQILAFAALICCTSSAYGWGVDGHLITCRLAQPRLSKAAADAVSQLLPAYADDDLSSMCSWADQVRFRYRWSSALHYIDTPDDLCSYLESLFDLQQSHLFLIFGQTVWANQAKAWEACSKTACPDAYATEGIKAACDWAYKGVSNSSVLEDDYFLSRYPVVNLRLAQGGVRLAATLNRIFG